MPGQDLVNKDLVNKGLCSCSQPNQFQVGAPPKCSVCSSTPRDELDDPVATDGPAKKTPSRWQPVSRGWNHGWLAYGLAMTGWHTGHPLREAGSIRKS